MAINRERYERAAGSTMWEDKIRGAMSVLYRSPVTIGRVIGLDPNGWRSGRNRAG